MRLFFAVLKKKEACEKRKKKFGKLEKRTHLVNNAEHTYRVVRRSFLVSERERETKKRERVRERDTTLGKIFVSTSVISQLIGGIDG